LRIVFKNYDKIIIENPIIGIFPIQTLAFKNLSQEDERIVYRVHDMVEDREIDSTLLKSNRIIFYD